MQWELCTSVTEETPAEQTVRWQISSLWTSSHLSWILFANVRSSCYFHWCKIRGIWAFFPQLGKHVAAKQTWLYNAQTSPFPVPFLLSSLLILNKLQHMAFVESQTLFAASHATKLCKASVLQWRWMSVSIQYIWTLKLIVVPSEPVSTDHRPS